MRLSVSYYFSTGLSVKMLSQYDQVNNLLTSNLRIRYNPREGTDLYIVFNQGLNSNTTRLKPTMPVVNSQAFIIKYLKTFSF